MSSWTGNNAAGSAPQVLELRALQRAQSISAGAEGEHGQSWSRFSAGRRRAVSLPSHSPGSRPDIPPWLPHATTTAARAGISPQLAALATAAFTAGTSKTSDLCQNQTQALTWVRAAGTPRPPQPTAAHQRFALSHQQNTHSASARAEGSACADVALRVKSIGKNRWDWYHFESAWKTNPLSPQRCIEPPQVISPGPL